MNGIRIGRHRGKRRVTCSPLLAVVLIFALSAAATGLSLLMQPGSIFAVAKTFLQQPLLILLNWFPPLVLTAIAYFLIGNVFYAGAVSSAVIPLMSYVNLLKIEGREDTFVPADITLIREALGAVRDYQLPMHYGKLALIVLFVGALIALGVLIGSPRPKWPIRLIAAADAPSSGFDSSAASSVLFSGAKVKRRLYLYRFHAPPEALFCRKNAVHRGKKMV